MIGFKDMALEDLDRVYEIEKASFPKPWSIETLAKELTENPHAKYRLLVDDGEILGYYGVWIVLDEVHLVSLAIAPEHRSKGYGKLLMEDLIEQAKIHQAAIIGLEVRVSNEAAINLYRAYGFEVGAIRESYYEDEGEDAYVMVLELEVL